jgi:hypothetical protein
MKYLIAGFVAFGIPILIGAGLYTIRNDHYAVTNVCNETFYPELCSKESQ